MNNQLLKYRHKINQIDKKMKSLFFKRMNLSKKIGIYKQENNLNITDSNREIEIKNNLSSDILDNKLKELYLLYLNNLIELSKAYQKDDNLIVYESFININKYIDPNKKVMLLIDEKVYNLYLDMINNTFKSYDIYIVKSGEESKDINNYLNIITELINHKYTKHDFIIGIGGGVVTDLCGFVSSSYKRGINMILVPTTMLSMVDASIGYKNGINFNNTKNQIGTFYEPLKIVIDFNFIKTLDQRIINEAYAEIIKIFLLLSKENFIKLENNLLSQEDIIKESCRLKQQIVLIDKYDKNIRNVLNFGHTIGHAVEGYASVIGDNLYHGECVAIGMVYFIDDKIKSRVENLLLKYNLPIKTNYSFDNIYPYLINDKKKDNELIKIVKVNDIGCYEFKYLTIEELKQIYNK